MGVEVSKLRIALLTDSLYRGGAQKQLVYAAKSLHEIGVDVRVFSFFPEGVFKPLLDEIGVPFIWIGQNNNRFARLMVLFRHLMDYRPHIIQTAQLYTGLYAALIGKLVRADSIASMRTDLALTNTSFGTRQVALSMRACSAVIVNSQKAFEDITSQKLASSASTYLLPNVVNLADFDHTATNVEDLPQGFRVVIIGRLIPIKRVDVFLDALVLAQQENPNIVGIVIGDGPEMEALKRRTAIPADKLSFLGSRNDVPNILQKCQALVLCSDYEGFPNVVIEAMSARLPVVTTPAGDSSRVVVDGKTGYIVPFGDARSIADRLILLAQHPELCAQLGQAGRQRVEEMYDYKTLGTRLLDIYTDLGQRRRNQRLLNALQMLKGGETN